MTVPFDPNSGEPYNEVSHRAVFPDAEVLIAEAEATMAFTMVATG